MLSYRDSLHDRLGKGFREVNADHAATSLRQIFEALKAESEFDQYYVANKALLTIGAPAGRATHQSMGKFQRVHNFGGLVNVMDVGIDLEWRTLINIEIAGVRCFATDDPGGTDEAFVIATVFALDPLEGERAICTVRFGPQDVRSHDVFGQGQRLDRPPFFVAGDGGVRVHLAIWDKEWGDPMTLERDYSKVAQTAIRTGLSAISLIPGAAWAGPALVALGETTGLSLAASEKVGEWAADILADDLIGQHDYVIDSDFLSRMKNSLVQDRISPSIPGQKYNFPESPEDNSWLITRGSGTGSYRVFFRIRTQTKKL